jgi:hypothetical protein
MIQHFFSPEMIYALGWTLIHTLWQGALFACLLAITLVALGRYSAQARYVVAVGLLFGFLATTVVTFVQFVPQRCCTQFIGVSFMIQPLKEPLSRSENTDQDVSG